MGGESNADVAKGGDAARMLEPVLDVDDLRLNLSGDERYAGNQDGGASMEGFGMFATRCKSVGMKHGQEYQMGSRWAYMQEALPCQRSPCMIQLLQLIPLYKEGKKGEMVVT